MRCFEICVHLGGNICRLYAVPGVHGRQAVERLAAWLSGASGQVVWFEVISLREIQGMLAV